MSSDVGSRPKTVLDPAERTAEVLFGLIMVLTFTGSLSIADSGRDDVRAMLIGAVGCNFAWGIIDGVFYLMGSLAERGRGLKLLHAVQSEPDAARGRRFIEDELPAEVVQALGDDGLSRLQDHLRKMPYPPHGPRLRPQDFRGAAGVFALVFLATLPVVVPFLIVPYLLPAMRISNAIAVTLLFAAGVSYARFAGIRPWATGLVMVALGLTLVGLTIALGG